jgi:small-conductance mechanosensitive channel
LESEGNLFTLFPFQPMLDVTIYYMETIFLNNSLLHWLKAMLVFAVVLFLLFLVRAFCRKKVKQNSNPKLLTRLLSQIILPTALMAAIWLASHLLEISEPVSNLLKTFLIALLTIQIGRWADLAVNHWTELQIEKLPDDDYTRRTSLRGIAIIARILIWLAAVLVIIQSIPNFDITGIITSLGIGGIAIGLAAQSLVADLLSSLTIHLDKPFEPGDSISTGDFSGTIEKIGLKSTSIRNLSGEELTISNSELLKTPIQNFSRMEERRVSFTIQIAGDTSSEKLALIPQLIESAFERLENVRFARAHFQALVLTGFVFEVVYFVTSPDYALFVKAQNLINYRIYQDLRNEGIFLSTTAAIPLEK